MDYIFLYKDSPTAGGTDGTQISQGTGLVPIVVGPVNATNNEVSAPQKLAVRCIPDYYTSGDVIIQPKGATGAKWALAPDDSGAAGEFGEFGASLTIATEIDDTNTIFWAKAKAIEGETADNYTDVKFDITATMNRVEV